MLNMYKYICIFICIYCVCVCEMKEAKVEIVG